MTIELMISWHSAKLTVHKQITYALARFESLGRVKWQTFRITNAYGILLVIGMLAAPICLKGLAFLAQSGMKCIKT